MKKKILIIDDDKVMRSLLKEIFREQPYTLYEAATGLEGIMQMVNKQPDLILLDVLLPDFNGLELCRQIRNKSDYSSMPIIFLSTQDQIDEIVDGFYVGADDYITKPFHVKELMIRVAATLRKKDMMDKKINEYNFLYEELRNIINDNQIFPFYEKINYFNNNDNSDIDISICPPMNSVYGNTRFLVKKSLEFDMYRDLEFSSWNRGLDLIRKDKDLQDIQKNPLRTFFLDCEINFVKNLNKEDEKKIDEIKQNANEVCFDLFELSKQNGLIDSPEFQDNLSLVRDKGVKVSMEDFGFSNFTYQDIKTLRPDYLKFDMSNFKNISSPKLKETILKKVNNVAEEYNITTIANNVDDEETFDLVQKHSINGYQGKYKV